MKKTRFQIEDDPIFEGFTDGSMWNGFDNPYFTLKEAKKVVNYYQSQECEETREQFNFSLDKPSMTYQGIDLYFFGGGYIWAEVEQNDL